MNNFVKKSTPLLNIPYDAQLKMKVFRATSALKMFVSCLKKSKNFTNELLNQIAIQDGLPCELEPIQSSPNILDYRNQLKTIVGFDKDGNIILGYSPNFLKNYKQHVISSELCDTLDKKHHINIVKLFETFIKEDTKHKPKYMSYKEPVWSAISIRSNRQNESLVHIHVNAKKKIPDVVYDMKNEILEKFLPKLQNEQIKIKSLYWKLNNFKSTPAQSEYTSKLIWGDKYIVENLCDKVFHIGPHSYFQVNTNVAEAILKSTKSIIEEHDNHCPKRNLILDICCGTGTFGIVLSNLAKKIIGVDVAQSAIENAIYNADKNNVSNIAYICEDVDDFITRFNEMEDINNYDEIIAILNPTKMGLSNKFCEQLRRIPSLKTIIYLSSQLEGEQTSNLLTLCQNNESLNIGDPFNMVKAIPFDQFPHTTQVDLILKLKR